MLYGVLARLKASENRGVVNNWEMSNVWPTYEEAQKKLDDVKISYRRYDAMLVKITGVEFIPASEREVEIPA